MLNLPGIRVFTVKSQNIRQKIGNFFQAADFISMGRSLTLICVY